jgi:uncharacterized protein YceK
MRKFLLLCLLCLLPSGCAAVGVIASAVPKPPVEAAYKGLQNQTVGVMVWADRGLRIDFPTIREDLASQVQTLLTAAQKEKIKDLDGATFPIQPASIVKYQKDHPELEAQPVTSVAPKLRVSRLIYVEINNLTTRTSQSVVMYRGNATASIKLVEVAPDGSAKVVFEEGNVSVSYPKKSPEDGRLEGSDYAMYAGTITLLADEVAKRFIEHPAEEQ